VCIFNSHITLNSSAYLYILVFHNLWLKKIVNAGHLTTKKSPKNNRYQTRFTRHPVAAENEHNFMCLMPFVTWVDKGWSNCWNIFATHHRDVHGHQIYVCNECMNECMCACIYPSIHLFIYQSIYRSTDLPIYLSVCLFVCLSFSLSLYLSIYIFIYLYFYLSIHRSIFFFFSLSLSLSPPLSIYLSIYLSIFQSINLSIYLII